MQRQRHGRSHQTGGSGGIGDSAGKDQGRRGSHGITASQDKPGDQFPPAGGQYNAKNGIPPGTSQCIGGPQDPFRQFPEGFLCPYFYKGQDHDPQRYSGGKDASAPGQFLDQKAIGKKPQYDGRDPGNAADHPMQQPLQCAASAVKNQIQGPRHGRDASQHHSCEGEAQAPGNGRPDASFQSQNGAPGRLGQKFPADGAGALNAHIDKQKYNDGHDQPKADQSPYTQAFSAHIIPPGSAVCEAGP